MDEDLGLSVFGHWQFLSRIRNCCLKCNFMCVRCSTVISSDLFLRLVLSIFEWVKNVYILFKQCVWSLDIEYCLNYIFLLSLLGFEN